MDRNRKDDFMMLLHDDDAIIESIDLQQFNSSPKSSPDTSNNDPSSTASSKIEVTDFIPSRQGSKRKGDVMMLLDDDDDAILRSIDLPKIIKVTTDVETSPCSSTCLKSSHASGFIQCKQGCNAWHKMFKGPEDTDNVDQPCCSKSLPVQTVYTPPKSKKYIPVTIQTDPCSSASSNAQLPDLCSSPSSKIQLPDFIRFKQGTVTYAWHNILEHLGPVSQWGPMRDAYRKAFWSPLHYKDRVLVGSFCYQNGMTIRIACEFFQLRNIDKFHVQKTIQLYDYWNHETEGFERRNRYFAYEIFQRCFADLNGVPRPGQKKYSIL